MEYNQTIKLKNGKNAIIRNATESDGSIVLDAFKTISAETDYLLGYPDEITFTPDEESSFLQKKADSANEIHIIALVDGVVVGIAGIDSCGSKYKIKHRAGMGVSVLKDYWGLGIGSALIDACIKCTKDAGYTQLILDVVSDNTRAFNLYKKHGFVELGRNPRGLCSRYSGYQEIIYMALDL